MTQPRRDVEVKAHGRDGLALDEHVGAALAFGGDDGAAADDLESLMGFSGDHRGSGRAVRGPRAYLPVSLMICGSKPGAAAFLMRSPYSA